MPSLIPHAFGRFILIGALAAGSHLSVVIGLVHYRAWTPLYANLMGFYSASWLSYIGHRYWTFQHKHAAKQAYWKFLLVAGLGGLLSELMLYELHHVAALHYIIAIIITWAFIPPLTYALTNYWVFIKS